MTENKRYRVFKYPDCEDYDVSDEVAQYTIATFNNHLEAEILCERLNELTDENEELKSRLEDAEGEIKRFDWDMNGIFDYNTTDEDYISEYEELSDLLNKLNDEKEQLKQRYAELKHYHDNLHDECAELELENNRLKNDIDSLLNFNNKASDLIEQAINEGVSEKAEMLLEKAIWWITDEG